MLQKAASKPTARLTFVGTTTGTHDFAVQGDCFFVTPGGGWTITVNRQLTVRISGVAGGGGGGASTAGNNRGGQGGGGGAADMLGELYTLRPGLSYGAQVGLAGLGATTNGSNGTSGGASYVFDAALSAYVFNVGGGTGGTAVGPGAGQGGVVGAGANALRGLDGGAQAVIAMGEPGHNGESGTANQAGGGGGGGAGSDDNLTTGGIGGTGGNGGASGALGNTGLGGNGGDGLGLLFNGTRYGYGGGGAGGYPHGPTAEPRTKGRNGAGGALRIQLVTAH